MPLVKQAGGEVRLLTLKCLLQNLPGFKISVGIHWQQSRDFQFHWTLIGEIKIPEEKKCPSL